MQRHILVADDEESIRQSLSGILTDEGFRVSLARDGESAIELVRKERPDLVLLDIWMPGMDGLETLRNIKEDYPSLPVVMISGHGNIETAVKATKLGAYEFIEKPLSLNEVVLMVNHVFELQRLEEENRLLRLRIEQKYEMIGESEAIRSLREQIARVAPTDSWVLITGENGTGKELAAREIHSQSRRSRSPFIEVNCAAIPEELIESELFGHEKGAFTGATHKKRGKFDLADGGSLFLDEIADMSLKTQARILRILQERKFERVGGTETIEVDVRVIAATNKDLEEEIKHERFREDLYYRLNVVPIHVPPLRERRDDVPGFVEFFTRDFHLRSGMERKSFTPKAIETLKEYNWPGNVRELKNVVERLLIMTTGTEIGVANVQMAIKIPAKPDDEHLFTMTDFREARGEFEKEFIIRKLSENDWNVTRTAEVIGMERSHLHRKIKSFGIESEKGNG